MTISFVQAFPPLWYIVGLDGLAAGGAQMFTYDNITREPKVVYQDAGGFLAFPNPVIFDLNGTKGPFYWKEDSDNPDDLYYVEVYDSAGNLLWQVNDFPTNGSGGGGNVTTYISIDNYITNNQFINHIGAQAGPLPTNLVVAPSNHKGFTPALTNPIVGTYGVLGPDVRFVKNNTNATDSLSFPTFALSAAPLTGDVTPVDYIRYQSNMASGETYKSFQFPITQKVKNLSNQTMTFGVWAAVTSTPVTINIYSRQYYGSGTGATAESTSTRVLQGSCSLTSTWTWFPITFTMPSVASGSLGTPGLQTDDDAVYIQIDMPLGEACDVLFTKPALYLGAIDPDIDFVIYDAIDSIDQTPRTGDIRVSYWSSAPPGWLYMNDGTIGNVGSGASLAAGQYTFQLYKTLWDAVSDTYAPVTGGRGATAQADFIANKPMQLPLSLGRALAAASTNLGGPVLGQNSGASSSSTTITANNLPAHTHAAPAGTTGFIVAQGGGTFAGQAGASLGSSIVTGNNATTATPLSIPTVPPTSYMNVFIKL